VVFAAAKLYMFLSLEFAFMLMLMIVVVGSLLAVIQNALPLALFAITGGFLAPILTSDGSGSHITLFSYYALLNVGIVGIAWYRSWRILNFTGFMFTFIIATAWGVLKYEPEFLMSTEPFLILFFLFYLLISILFTLKQPFKPLGFIDATLVFELPLVAFALQVSLVDGIEYAVFYSAFVVGIIYLVLFKILYRYENMRLLSEAFLALGVVFMTIAVPYALDDHLSSALWVLEASAIIWVSLKQEKRYARLFGYFFLILSIGLFIISSLFRDAEMGYINVIFMGYIVVISTTLFSSYILYSYANAQGHYKGKASLFFLVVALATWLFAGLVETSRVAETTGNIMLLYIAMGATIFAFLASKFKWSEMLRALQLYLFLGIFFFLSLVEHYWVSHPFADLGLLAVILFFSVHYILLIRFDNDWEYQTIIHLLGLWLLVGVLMREMQFQMSLVTDNLTWQALSLVFLPLLLSLLFILKKNFLIHSLKKYQEIYRTIGVAGLMLVIIVWELYSFALIGDLQPLHYLVLFNPLDVVEILVMFSFSYWVYSYKEQLSHNIKIASFITISLMIMILSSVIFARSVHHYRDIVYTIPTLADDIFFQAGLSILWTLLAIIVMLFSKYLSNRLLWIVGFTVLLLVVLKLFVVELASSGTIERIISFIAVGGLMLLIGYFAPLPPKLENEEKEA
jgi:uncharacterized membrane protein